MVKKEPNEIDPVFRKLYPHLSDDELIEAQENFDSYLDLVWQIFLRIKDDPAEYARFKQLTEELRKKDSNPDPPPSSA